jgi:cell division septation protein DedD
MKRSFVNMLAAAAVGMAAPAIAQQSVKAGIDAWQRGDYPAAVTIWKPLADKGNADAAFNLGQAYRLGRGVPVDLAQAQRWLVKAAATGHVDAETTLGLLLFDSGSRGTALQWLKKAAEQGEPRAMLVYGTALFNGDDVARDPVMAYAYVSRAAAQGLQPAKDTLQEMDQAMPLAARQKGLAIAQMKAKAAPAPGTPAKAKAKAPALKPAPVATAAETKPTPGAKAPAPAQLTSVAAGAGGWRVQLGAFSQRSSAEALFRRFAGSLAGHQAYYVAAGPVTRLQVGPYPSRAAAQSACASLHGQACFPVPGK